MLFKHISLKPLGKYSSKKAIFLALLTVVCISEARVAQAEFVLNFQAENRRFEDPEWLNFNCNRGGGGGEDNGFEECDKNDLFRDNNGRDGTAFLMERVRDPNSSDQYYHTIIGEEGSDFVQEAYIKITRYYADDDCDNGCTPRSTPTKVDDLGPISDSLGDWRDIDKYTNNAYDPMGPARFSGSGTANPKSTQFRQVMANNGFEQDMTKAKFNQKHLLTQTLDVAYEGNARLEHRFELDMTNSTFDQADIAGVMKENYYRMTGSGSQGSIWFDITEGFFQDRGGFDITGGKYTFARLYNTTINNSGPLENEYSGEGAGYNVWNENWKAYYDESQNNYAAPSRNGDDDDDDDRRRPDTTLYSCYDDCGAKYEPWEGGATWSSWSSNRMSGD